MESSVLKPLLNSMPPTDNDETTEMGVLNAAFTQYSYAVNAIPSMAFESLLLLVSSLGDEARSKLHPVISSLGLGQSHIHAVLPYIQWKAVPIID